MAGAIVVALLLAGFQALSVSALAPQTSPFQRTWERTDQPVANQSAVRTWMWGLSAFSALM